jgi:hypothetical protein
MFVDGGRPFQVSLAIRPAARVLGTTTRKARRWIELNRDKPCVQELQRPIINKGRDRRTGLGDWSPPVAG